MTIRISTADAVTTLRFDRLDRKNAITQQMYAQLADGLRAAAADPEVRVAMLCGHESVFTSGNDVGDFLERSKRKTAEPASGEAPTTGFLKAISEFPKPLIASVCGPAIGVGSTMLLHCDLVYAGDNARFSFPFVNLGLVPEAASSLLLPRLAGHVRAAEKLLFGEPFDANEALQIGMVNRVVPAVEADGIALSRARELAAKPLSSLVATKALMKKPLAALTPQAMQDELALFGRMLGEPAAREAFTAFLEKRKPDFSRIR